MKQRDIRFLLGFYSQRHSIQLIYDSGLLIRLEAKALDVLEGEGFGDNEHSVEMIEWALIERDLNANHFNGNQTPDAAEACYGK